MLELPAGRQHCHEPQRPRGMTVDRWVALIVAVRLAAAFVNIVHDCDEVYNYWEPLHYLLHGNGMQTWEYRCGLCTVAHTQLSNDLSKRKTTTRASR